MNLIVTGGYGENSSSSSVLLNQGEYKWYYKQKIVEFTCKPLILECYLKIIPFEPSYKIIQQKLIIK